MGKFRGVHHLLCLTLFFGAFGILFGSQLALAAQESSQVDILLAPGQEEPTPEEAIEERLEVFSHFPIQQNIVGSSFEFEITIYYEGSEAKTFDLDMTLSEGWTGVFKGDYPETVIPAFTAEPMEERQTFTFTVTPVQESLPSPGDYVFTIRAYSDTVSASLDLKAVVIPRSPLYQLYMANAMLQNEFSVKPNQNNHVSVQLLNTQNGIVNNIIFSAEKPEGWNVTFTPSTLTSLEPGVTQEIDIAIMPPRDAEAGDYSFILKAIGDETETELEYRITVVTSTAWGAASIGVAIAIIVGLSIWFRRAGTRGETETAGSTSWFKRTLARFRHTTGK
ncbi:NEW3 domain-containing protein [Chloroflexota bacterium]